MQFSKSLKTCYVIGAEQGGGFWEKLFFDFPKLLFYYGKRINLNDLGVDPEFLYNPKKKSQIWNELFEKKLRVHGGRCLFVKFLPIKYGVDYVDDLTNAGIENSYYSEYVDNTINNFKIIKLMNFHKLGDHLSSIDIDNIFLKYGIYLVEGIRESIIDNMTVEEYEDFEESFDQRLIKLKKKIPYEQNWVANDRSTAFVTLTTEKSNLIALNWLNHQSKKNIQKRINLWIQQRHDVKCEVCGNQYSILDIEHCINLIPYQVCGHCKFRVPGKNGMEEEFKKFLEACNGQVTATLIKNRYRFWSSIDKSKAKQIYEHYVKMGGMAGINKVFTSYQALFLKVVGPIKSGRGYMCLAKDGHVCNSYSEKLIDDWLSDHAIDHEKEPNYPVDELVNPKAKLRADWKIENILVEYFGMMGQKVYRNKAQKKIDLVEKSGLDLICLYPKDLNDKSLTNKFKRFL